MIILFPLILQTPHPNPPKYSTTLRDKNRALNEMFIRAASTKYPKLVEAFLKKGADVNAKDRNGFTALMGAVFPGVKRAIFLEVQIEVVKLLLENGADVNAKDKYGRTALMMTSNRPKRFRQLLINYGAKE
jgi:ankyrin repeat protein